MKAKILVVLFFVSCGLFAAEKFTDNAPSGEDVPPTYIVTITGVNSLNYVEIKLTPARFLNPGEKIKVMIDDNCGNLVYADTLYGPSSVVRIYKTEFDLSNPCFEDGNGNQVFNVYAQYDLNDGNPSDTEQIFI